MAALLTVERHNTEKVGLLIAECRRMGIEVLPPSVNVSANGFTIEELPLASPEGGQEKADDHLHRARSPFSHFPCRGDRHPYGPRRGEKRRRRPGRADLRARGARSFASLADFANRVDLRQVNRRAWSA